VAGANDLITVQFAAGDFRAIMRADVFDRIITALDSEYRHIGSIDIDNHIFAVSQSTLPANIDPFRHQ
jgi:hypothetical protein